MVKTLNITQIKRINIAIQSAGFVGTIRKYTDIVSYPTRNGAINVYFADELVSKIIPGRVEFPSDMHAKDSKDSIKFLQKGIKLTEKINGILKNR